MYQIQLKTADELGLLISVALIGAAAIANEKAPPEAVMLFAISSKDTHNGVIEAINRAAESATSDLARTDPRRN
jgi:hypothetical protein